MTRRGFINQEQMDGGVCLDNLNARIYDPTLGRFLSPDPVIGNMENGQQLMVESDLLIAAVSSPASDPKAESD